MRTLKNLNLIAIVMILLFACEDPFKDQIVDNNSSESELSNHQLISLENDLVSARDIIENMEVIIYLEDDGEYASKELRKSLEFKLDQTFGRDNVEADFTSEYEILVWITTDKSRAEVSEKFKKAIEEDYPNIDWRLEERD